MNSQSRGVAHRSEIHINVLVESVLIRLFEVMLENSVDPVSRSHIQAIVQLSAS